MLPVRLFRPKSSWARFSKAMRSPRSRRDEHQGESDVLNIQVVRAKLRLAQHQYLPKEFFGLVAPSLHGQKPAQAEFHSHGGQALDPFGTLIEVDGLAITSLGGFHIQDIMGENTQMESAVGDLPVTASRRYRRTLHAPSRSGRASS